MAKQHLKAAEGTLARRLPGSRTGYTTVPMSRGRGFPLLALVVTLALLAGCGKKRVALNPTLIAGVPAPTPSPTPPPTPAAGPPPPVNVEPRSIPPEPEKPQPQPQPPAVAKRTTPPPQPAPSPEEQHVAVPPALPCRFRDSSPPRSPATICCNSGLPPPSCWKARS